MAKKYLALFLTVAMLVSSFVSVPVFADDAVTETEVSTETIPMLTIATDSFSTDDYNKSWGTQISSSYVDASAIAGAGWASNWLEKTLEGNVASTTTNVKSYPAKGDSTDMALQSKADVVMARELGKTISLSGTGKYTFKLDAKSTHPVGANRQPFALLIGDSLEAGYTVNSTDNNIIPYIKVGSGEAVPATTTTTLDGQDAGSFTTLELTVELNADGNDVITLTATDSAKLASTVTTTADVTGSSNTIYFDMYNAFIDNITIKGVDYTAVNNTKALYDGIEVESVASESFATNQYSFAWSNMQVYNRYTDASVVTGTGWESNWKTLVDGAVADFTTENVELYQSKGASSDLAIRGSEPAVRELLNDITFADSEVKYVLSLKNKGTSANAANTFAVKIGNVFEAGYENKKINEVAAMVPYIKVNGTTVYAEDSVSPSGSGKDTGEYNKIDISVYPGIDSDDVISVTVEDTAGATATITTTADLAGAAEYIAFGLNGHYIDDITLTKYDRATLPEEDDPTEDEGLYPLAELAREEFSTDVYGNGGDTVVGTSYGNLAEGEYAGTGWGSNWLMKDENGYVAANDPAATIYKKNGDNSSYGVGIRYYKDDAAAALYRKLGTPVTFENTDGKYIFGLDIKLTNASTNTFQYILNDNVTAGYTINSAGKTVPYITVGETTVSAKNSMSIEAGYAKTNLSKFKVIIELNKDGEDKITVRMSKDGMNAGVSTTADLTGSCEYIGIEGASIFFDDLYIKGVNYGDYDISATEIYPVVPFAEETIASEEYSKGATDKNINGAYADGLTSTGKGWDGLWFVKDSDDTDYRAPEDADKLAYGYTNINVTPYLKVNNMPAGTTAYRLLDNAIDFNGASGKYVFSVDVQNGFSSSKSSFRYNIGGLFAVGYNSVSSTEGSPLIEIGGKTVVTSDAIVLGPTNDSSKNIFYRFVTEVHLRKDGIDVIKVNIYNRGSGNSTESTTPVATLYASANLNGTVEYIAFNSKNGSSSSYRVDNITVGGYTPDMIAESESWTVTTKAVETILPEQYANGSNYTAGNDISAAYSKEVAEDGETEVAVETGTGWNGNWVVKNSTGADVDTSNVLYYKPSNAVGEVVKVGISAGQLLYRYFDEPFVFSGVNGKYVFSVDVQNGKSNTSKLPFRYNIGGMFAVGYNVEGTDNTAVPVIEVGGKTVAKANKTIFLGDGSADDNIFYTADVEVHLNKAGTDIIRYKIYKRGTPAEAITLYAAADLDTNPEYIAFGSKSGEASNYRIDNIYVKGIDDANLPTKDDPTEDTFLYPTDLSVSEEFKTSQYGTDWDKQVGTVYNNLDTNGCTGTGWATNWLLKGTDGTYVPTNSATYDAAATTYPTDGSSANAGVGIRYFKGDGAAALYRKLGTPVRFDNIDGKYIFGLDIKALGNANADFKYVINDNITAGYKFVSGKVVPFITVGDTTVNAKNSIAIQNGATTTPLSKFKIIVELNQKGADKITVRLSTDGMNASAALETDLTGSCEYIGIDGSNILYDNLYITGSNYTVAKQFTRTAHTLSYKDADGQTQNAAGISEIPADIRNVSVYVQYKNGGRVDYEDDGVTPKDHCAAMLLTGFYYDGKLVVVKRAGDQVKAGQSTHTTHSFTISSDNGWVELDEFDWSKVTIKSYIFAWNTFEPLCEVGVFEGEATVAPEPKVIYVKADAPAGGNGTEEKPYNSINAAKFAVRNSEYPEDGVVIKLEGDFYTKDFVSSGHPEEYLWLQSGMDKGEAGAPLVFEGVNGARIIGGIKLDLASDFVATEAGDTINNSNVVKYVAEKGLLTAALPVTGSSTPSVEGKPTTPYFQVIFKGESMDEGKSMTLARWPNEGFDVVSTVYNEGNEATNDGFEFTSARIASEGKLAQWENDNIAVHGYWNVDYHDFGTPATVTANGLKGVYAPASGRELKKTLSEGQSGYNRRFYVENSPEDLDIAGEWYIESTDTNDILYFWPTEATGEVIIGTTTDTIIKGDNSNYVTLKNLNIVGGRSSGIQISGTGVTVSGCTVNGVAGTGISVTGSNNSVIENCHVYDVGAGGMVLVGGTRRGTTPKKGNNVARNNIIHDFAKVRFNYSYGLELGGYANVARNNEIYNAPGVAVTMTGWDLVFKNNKVHDVLKEASDMGAIYVGKSKARRGGQILNNHFYDLETSSKLDGGVDISAIFMDDISDGYTVKGNIFENIKGRGFRTNGGRDHTVTGNVFVNVRTNAAFKSVYGSTTQLGYILDDPIMTSGMYQNFTEYPHLAELVVPTANTPENAAENAKAEIMWPKYNKFSGNYTYDNVYGNDKVDLYLVGDYPTESYSSVSEFMTNACESTYEASTVIGAIENNNYSAYGINYAKIGVEN